MYTSDDGPRCELPHDLVFNAKVMTSGIVKRT